MLAAAEIRDRAMTKLLILGLTAFTLVTLAVAVTTIETTPVVACSGGSTC
jgi:hypothetical protein